MDYTCRVKKFRSVPAPHKRGQGGVQLRNYGEKMQIITGKTGKRAFN